MSSVLAELDLLHGELPVVGIVGLAVLVRSTFGFGDALVAMPLLLLVIDDQVSAVALVEKNSNPSEEEIIQAMEGNLCRCGTYTRIKRAIRQAAEKVRNA